MPQTLPEQQREEQCCGSRGVGASCTFEQGLVRRIRFSREGPAFHLRQPRAEWSAGPHCSVLPGTRGLPGLEDCCRRGREGPCTHALRAGGGQYCFQALSEEQDRSHHDCPVAQNKIEKAARSQVTTARSVHFVLVKKEVSRFLVLKDPWHSASEHTLPPDLYF